MAGGLAALLLATAGVVLFGRARPVAVLPARPVVAASGQAAGGTAADASLPDSVPEASERTREQKRFDRNDKDRDGTVTRAEYLQPRRKAFAKLDANGDGQLSFDEWAAKAEGKFAAADADKSGGLTRPEFASTAVKHRAGPRRGPCAPATAAQPAREAEDDS
jgi:hypothetical protein